MRNAQPVPLSPAEIERRRIDAVARSTGLARRYGRTWASCKPGGEYGTMSVVLAVMREEGRPLRVPEIVAIAGSRLAGVTLAASTEGRRNVVARDLVRELRRRQPRVRRISYGLYGLVAS